MNEYIDDALCSQTDPEAFFPSRGESTKAAKKVCEVCIVLEPCLTHALQDASLEGVRGGKSERERRKLRKKIGE